jgi:hypothetical protein
MHLDHSKLVELLTDASGIEKDKVEEQLSELVAEIQEAIAEGDAYEVNGLGVFSGIGNNVIFIPADDLATEINYKYVGMEPIELESGSVAEDDPGTEADSDLGDEDDPFGGLLDDEDDDEDSDASFSLDVPTQDEGEEEYEDSEAEEENEAPFDLAGDETDEEDLEIESPGPDKWGIDTYKDDSDAGMFSGLLGDKKEPESKDEEEAEDDLNNIFDDSEDEDDLETQISKQLSDEKIEDSKDELKDVLADGQEDDEDFDDDPFDSLEEEESDDTDTKEEVVPVITNLASDAAKKKREEEAQEDSAEDEDESTKTKRSKPSRNTGSPVLLWVVLIIVIFAGGTYALGYFGVVNIPGVTPQPQIAATQPQQTQQPVEQDPAPSVQETEPQSQESQQPAEPQPEEQPTAEQPAETQVSGNSAAVPDGQPKYGLRGVSSSAANDGYTIVVFSLSKEGNARAKLNELNNYGYRALLASIPSQQYGQLWRVSLGQFESLRTAALAADTLKSPFSENYFITKIK